MTDRIFGKSCDKMTLTDMDRSFIAAELKKSRKVREEDERPVNDFNSYFPDIHIFL